MKLQLAVLLALASAPLRPQTTAAAPPLPRAFLEVGAGYAAKTIASAVFVSGRTLESVLAQELAPDTPLERMLRPLLDIDVDRQAGTATVRVGDVQRVAVFRPGLGCTLALGVDPGDLAARTTTPPPWPADLPSRPWPVGDRTDAHVWPEGADAEVLTAAADAAFREDGPRPIRTRAVLVVHRDRILYERYADGFHRDMPLPGWSMAKSLTSALVGIRLAQCDVALDDPLPIDAWRVAGDPRGELTWRHLLTMSSGLRWDESYVDPSGSVARMLFGEPGAGAFAAAQDLAHPIGARWQYASGTTNVLCLALRATFGADGEADSLAFPARALFARIGMRTAVLEPDASGVFVGSSFALASARDWARLGLLYLHDGVWNGERVLPEGWVAATVTPASAAPNARYGLHWWLNASGRKRGLPVDTLAAHGFQGQTVVVIPSRDLVVVRLACTKNERDFDDDAMVAAIVAALPPVRER